MTKCPVCHKAYWAGRGYVPHADGCPRKPKSKTERRIERPSKTVRWPEYGPYDRSGYYVREKADWRRQATTPNQGADGTGK